MDQGEAILLILPRLTEGDALSKILRSDQLDRDIPEHPHARKQIAAHIAEYCRERCWYLVATMATIEAGYWQALKQLHHEAKQAGKGGSARFIELMYRASKYASQGSLPAASLFLGVAERDFTRILDRQFACVTQELIQEGLLLHMRSKKPHES